MRLRGGVGVRMGRSVELVVGGFANEVDAEGDDGDTKAGNGMTELVSEHRVLPPLVPPPEKLSRRSQWLPHSFSLLIF